jgi:hypothetical protein
MCSTNTRAQYLLEEIEADLAYAIHELTYASYDADFESCQRILQFLHANANRCEWGSSHPLNSLQRAMHSLSRLLNETTYTWLPPAEGTDYHWQESDEEEKREMKRACKKSSAVKRNYTLRVEMRDDALRSLRDFDEYVADCT